MATASVAVAVMGSGGDVAAAVESDSGDGSAAAMGGDDCVATVQRRRW